MRTDPGADLQGTAASSGRGPLYHSLLRQSGVGGAGARRGAYVRENCAGFSPRKSHAVAYLHASGVVGGIDRFEPAFRGASGGGGARVQEWRSTRPEAACDGLPRICIPAIGPGEAGQGRVGRGEGTEANTGADTDGELCDG